MPLQADLFAVEQAPHAPLGWQAGVAPPQSLSDAHVRQLWVVASQTGLPAGQSYAVTQPTQVPLVALQTGVDAAH